MSSKYERQVMIYEKNQASSGSLSMWDVYFNPTRAHVDDEYKALMSPLENGIKHLDHKVAELVRIEVSGYVYIDGVDQFYELAYEKLESMELDKALCTVSTKGGVYDDCLLLDIKEDDHQDKFDVIEFTLTFVQVIIDDANFESNNGNSKTKSAGLMGSSPYALRLSPTAR